MIEQLINPFLTLAFDRVKMYDYEPVWVAYNYQIADINDRLLPEEHINMQVELDAETIHELNLKMGDEASYGEDIMRCYIPHLAFVYFLNDEIVCHISICMECNNIRSSIKIPAEEKGRGMTSSFRKYLMNLMKANFQ